MTESLSARVKAWVLLAGSTVQPGGRVALSASRVKVKVLLPSERSSSLRVRVIVASVLPAGMVMLAGRPVKSLALVSPEVVRGRVMGMGAVLAGSVVMATAMVWLPSASEAVEVASLKATSLSLAGMVMMWVAAVMG